MLTPREREALEAMIGIAEEDTEEWERNLPDDDNDPSVEDSEAASVAARRVTIAEARAALARVPLVLGGPEVRAWRYEPGRGTEYIESLPLERIGEWDTGPNGYAVYVAESPGSPLQRHLSDCATLADARAVAEAIGMLTGLASGPTSDPLNDYDDTEGAESYGYELAQAEVARNARAALGLPPVDHPAHTVSYAFPGVLVYRDAEGDVGIDVDGEHWRACAYAGTFEMPETLIGTLRVRMGDTEADPGAPIAGADAFTEEETPNGIMLRLPDGGGVLISRSHLFAYVDADDGGSCTGALHRIADVESDHCNAIGCPLVESGAAR